MSFYFRLIAIVLLVTATGWTQAVPAGIPSSYEISELKTRAEGGDAKAQVRLGRVYEDGIGVPVDVVAAVRWYRKAAEQGDPAGENSLGVMYRLGRGVDKDQTEAVRWYHQAARQGYADAYFNLGTAYYNGDGAATDYDLAYAWFAIAAAAGSEPAQDAVQRTGGEISGTLDIAYVKTGHLLEVGEELPANLPEAARWYRKAADMGNIAAEWKLGELYALGRGVPKDDALAESWRAKALKHPDPDLMFQYANMLRTGNGAPANPVAAAEWYRRAAALRHSPAMLNLGLMYWQGTGVPHDNVKAYVLIVGAEYGGGQVGATAAQALREVEKQMSPEEVEKAKKQAKKSYANWRRGSPSLTPTRKP